MEEDTTPADPKAELREQITDTMHRLIVLRAQLEIGTKVLNQLSRKADELGLSLDECRAITVEATRRSGLASEEQIAEIDRELVEYAQEIDEDWANAAHEAG